MPVHGSCNHKARATSGPPPASVALVLLAVTLVVTVPATDAVGAPARNAPTCDGRPATLVGTSGDDVLRGTSGADVVVGLGGDDMLVGRGGDDVLCGGDGYDVLLGGPGADRLHGGRDGFHVRFDEDWGKRVGDHLAGGPGHDHLDPGRDPRAGVSGRHGGFETLDVVSFAGSRRGVRVDLRSGRARGTGRDTVVARGPLQVFGSRHDDELRGGRHAVRLVAGGGDDVLRGGRGDDHLWSTRGSDVLEAGRGDDQAVWFNRAVPQVDAGTGRDRVSVDDVVDWTGARVLFADDGDDDRLDLGLARRGDRGWGAADWDLGTGVLVLDGVPSDTVVARARRIFVESDLVLQVRGSARPEVLTMEGGRTLFTALGGNDVFTGYTERDLFDGGEGRDTYRRDYGPARSNDCVGVEADPRDACAA